MTYHGGIILHANRTHIVFWEPTGFSLSARYRSLAEQYLGDLAADSGRATNPYAIDTQYDDSANDNIRYSQTFAGAVSDNAAFPRRDSRCATPGTSTVCLTQDQEASALHDFIKASGLPLGQPDDIYFLVLPANVQTCFNSFSACGPYSGDGYCAYHSAFDQGDGLIVWANMPDGADAHCNEESAPPNGDGADTLISTLSHEHNEIITDPIVTPDGDGSGWYDETTGGENGDLCNSLPGPALGTTATGAYDTLINHHPYEIQMEWSNATSLCAMNYGVVPPTAKFTYAPNPPHAQDVVQFDGRSSSSGDTGGYITDYRWDFGDGTMATGPTPSHTFADPSAVTITLTVTDDAGLTSSIDNHGTIAKRPTATGYTGPTSADFNDPVTVTGYVADGETRSGLGGRAITFTLGSQSCSATTDGSGNAACSIRPTQSPGSYTISASSPGDALHTGSSDSQAFRINQEESQISYTGVRSSDYYDVFTASATLIDPDGGAAIPGKTIAFQLGATDVCTAVTDGSGVASCQIRPKQDAGSYNMVASFGPDVDYLSSADTQPFTITREETITTVSVDPPGQSTFGQRATFTAAVAGDDPGTPNPTGDAAFNVDATPVGSVPLSNGAGTTSTTSLSAGAHAIAADYGGSRNFLPSGGVSPYTVVCDVNIDGAHSGTLIVTATTCLRPGAKLDGAIVVKSGGALDIESASVSGAVNGDAGVGVIRICASAIGGTVDIGGSGGLVLVGDSGDAACAPNSIGGALVLKDNANGVEAIDNTVVGAIDAGGNSGQGPYPGDPTTISGNHPPTVTTPVTPGTPGTATSPATQGNQDTQLDRGPPTTQGDQGAQTPESVPTASLAAPLSGAAPVLGGLHVTAPAPASARRNPAAARAHRPAMQHRARRSRAHARLGRPVVLAGQRSGGPRPTDRPPGG
jgi:PKD repeat protein